MKQRIIDTPAFLSGAGVLVFCLVFVGLTFFPGLVLAAGAAGEEESRILADFIYSPWGTVLGLVAALIGLWQFLIYRSFWGLIVIVLGVLFTMFPGLFTSLYNGVIPMVEQTGGTRTEINL
jgi:hypothetical protein